MSIINFRSSIDSPVHVCGSLVSLAQGLALVAKVVVKLDVAASSRTDIADALSSAVFAVHHAAMVMEGAYRGEGAIVGQRP